MRDSTRDWSVAILRHLDSFRCFSTAGSFRHVSLEYPRNSTNLDYDDLTFAMMSRAGVPSRTASKVAIPVRMFSFSFAFSFSLEAISPRLHSMKRVVRAVVSIGDISRIKFRAIMRKTRAYSDKVGQINAPATPRRL